MTTLTLQPDATAGIDTTLREFTPTFNFGVATVLSMGWDVSSSKKRRGLIKFDLSGIPSGALILSASLQLYCTSEIIATDFTIGAYRSLVAWFEGVNNSAAPGAGVDGSTWNNKNANGSVAWGALGGQSGVDYNATPTASVSITTTGQFFNWNVAVDVQNFVSGLQSNFGWWLINNTESGANTSLKDFASSDNSTAANRPTLVIVYQTLDGTIAGTSTATGILKGKADIEGSAAGAATATAFMSSNQNIIASAAGTSIAVAFLRAISHAHGNSFGDSTATATIHASYHSVGSAAGTSFHVAHLRGRFNLTGAASGLGTATAHIFTKGQIQGAAFGTSEATATGYARAKNVAAVVGCNPVPLLYITDGGIKSNGQLNILNFLSERNGYWLRTYKPQIPGYKDGGYFSSSPQSQGRRLWGKSFDNAIDVFEVSAKASDQDAVIQYQQDLIAFQEAASDYWTSNFSFLPYYLVARAARETNTRYAIIHMISCPELENPFDQPFFDHQSAVFASLTIRIEHGLWLSTPPGKFDCVEVSSAREWTVSGWQVGV